MSFKHRIIEKYKILTGKNPLPVPDADSKISMIELIENNGIERIEPKKDGQFMALYFSIQGVASWDLCIEKHASGLHKFGYKTKEYMYNYFYLEENTFADSLIGLFEKLENILDENKKTCHSTVWTSAKKKVKEYSAYTYLFYDLLQADFLKRKNKNR